MLTVMNERALKRACQSKSLKVISVTTKVILTIEDVITGTLKVISATAKVILATEEVITATLKAISATTKVILAIKNDLGH